MKMTKSKTNLIQIKPKHKIISLYPAFQNQAQIAGYDAGNKAFGTNSSTHALPHKLRHRQYFGLR